MYSPYSIYKNWVDIHNFFYKNGYQVRIIYKANEAGVMIQSRRL